jgi:hypothetical protein
MDRYFYSVEMDGDRKVVHLFGNVYYNNADETKSCYRHAEWTGLYLTIEEIQNLSRELYFYDYIGEKVAYLSDLTQAEMIDLCHTYFNGTPGNMLRITEVDEDTPCGDYWF